MTTTPTRLIIQWMLSAPVLAHHMMMIATDEPVDPEHQELICTVVDLLDPHRSQRWAEVLQATGASVEGADALWEALGSDPNTWMPTVRWEAVRKALVDAPRLDV